VTYDEWMAQSERAGSETVLHGYTITSLSCRARLKKALTALRAVEAECARADENYGYDAGVTSSDAIRSAVREALGVGDE
jgi:hypothetical protein